MFETDFCVELGRLKLIFAGPDLVLPIFQTRIAGFDWRRGNRRQTDFSSEHFLMSPLFTALNWCEYLWGKVSASMRECGDMFERSEKDLFYPRDMNHILSIWKIPNEAGLLEYKNLSFDLKQSFRSSSK